MNKTVKKTAAVITALVLAIQSDFFVFAAEEGEDREIKTGQVNVSVSPALPLKSGVEFTAELDGTEVKTLTLEAGGTGSEISFQSLSDGDHTLKVSAEGFADYVQTVSVNGQAESVKLMTGFAEGIDYRNGAHPGTLLIGDVNGDGAVDGNDRRQLADAVDGGIGGLAAADLNGDGSVDLVDLEYLAMGYNVELNTQAVSETVIPSVVIIPSAGENTSVSGSLDSLFARNGSVLLSPAGGENISAKNPVSLEFEITDAGSASRADGIVIGVKKDNPLSKAEVDIDYIGADGGEYTQVALIENGVHHLLDTEDVTVEKDGHGNIHINLGTQIAVKKVTFIISGMVKDGSLAEISYVEFVNGMENKIPEPAADIPENLRAEAKSKAFVLTWDRCVNVTGYEVMISQGGASDTQRVTGNSLAVSAFMGRELENGTQYTVRVQSVNGGWQSGYGEEITVVPKADKKPDRPDGLTAAGAYRSIRLSWKKAEDAEWYNVYYKLSDEDSYTKSENITGTGYILSGLEDKAEYTIYVTAANEHGESGASLTAAASTTDINPAVMPKYHLINAGEDGEIGQHIVSASQNHGDMIGSVFDESVGTAFGTVDKNPNSYYMRNTWDDGGFNGLGNRGLFYEFDEEYTIQTIALQEAVQGSLDLYYAKVNYWDAEGNLTSLGNNKVSIRKKTDGEGRVYYLVRLAEKAQVKRIQIGLARYLASGNINVSEVYFYYYDTVAEDIEALYQDDLHLVLRPDVTQSDIDALRERINAPDEVSGELNPDREILERELKNAEDILNSVDLGAPVEIHNAVSTYDVNRGFGGLNAWQPIGVSAAAGDTVTVYVGHNAKGTGELTNLQLVATQFHAESGNAAKTVASLKTGANIVDIPKLWSINEESGGALYIQYTGNNPSDRYAVRVSGGVRVPVLDLYGVEAESERLQRTAAYIEALEEYTSQTESLHRRYHEASSNGNVNKYEYSAKNCILGASDILLDNMLLSLPANQIIAGAGQGTVSEKAERALASFNAMEDMLKLFYQHKGLNRNAENETDRLSRQHLNIRYQRMFSGAFMYAAGNHIGIEWNQCGGMLSSPSVVSDADGRYVSGSYFGWGIAHEIGHCINQGAYAVAEITNNYFAQLAQAKDSNAGMRFSYENIYGKVTSGATGQSSNLATQLGMYWQLHLAYDTDYNYKTYEDHAEQLNSLFYARVDSYARTPSLAPAPDGVGLVLGGSSDQNLMRLACAAAEKNILEFFERWGKIPDSETISYASQFEKEERAIYYTDDDSRVYRIENPGTGYLGTGGNVRAVSADTSAAADTKNPYQVNFKLSAENIPAEELLGYEIVRCTVSGGRTVRETVGFTAGNTFTDRASGLNNRVVTYEVIAVDKYLYRSAPKTLEPIKIRDDGSLDKTWWTADSKGIAPDNVPDAGTGSDDTPCAPTAENPVIAAIDGNSGTEYAGTLSEDAEIVISFNKRETVSGFRYTAGSGIPAEEYVFMIRAEDGTWIEAASGVLGGSKTVYFENADRKYVSTYRTDAVKLVIPNRTGEKISVAEIDVLGVTGDNVDFRTAADGSAAIGVLSADYKYGSGETDFIPKNSIVFTGSYKGNPAYNTVMLFDQNGSVIGGTDSHGYLKAQQIILADDPGSGLLQDVANGTWIYWIDPSDKAALDGVKQVRAELYRVNNALTNEGERLVSDSMPIDFPETLPEITIGGGSQS